MSWPTSPVCASNIPASVGHCRPNSSTVTGSTSATSNCSRVSALARGAGHAVRADVPVLQLHPPAGVAAAPDADNAGRGLRPVEAVAAQIGQRARQRGVGAGSAGAGLATATATPPLMADQPGREPAAASRSCSACRSAVVSG